MYCSLQDIKSDNYVICDNTFLHVPIDFGSMSPNTFEKDFEFIKHHTLEKLQISSKDYSDTFMRLEYELALRMQKAQKLPKLIKLMQNSTNPTLIEVANDIKEKRKYLQSKYF